MASPVFYRKWRPQAFIDVVGQEHVTKTLQHALEKERVAHAYLFCGPRGTGKTSTGRILAKAVNCLSSGRGEPCNACEICQSVTEGRCLDVIEVDAASNRRIDDIRDLREKVNFAPNVTRYKVYIIDEVHMLTDEASNALLKTLEEPPPYVIFILATTEPHKVLATILSRCQRFDFRRLSREAVISRLAHIADKEDITIPQEALRLIARNATGSLRDAENLLEQLVAYYGHQIDLPQVQVILGSTGDARIRKLAGHIINRNIAEGLELINSVSSEGFDLRQFTRELVEYLRGVLLVKSGSEKMVDVTADDLAEMRDIVASVSLEHILTALKLFGQVDLRLDNYSPLPLELALVEYVLSRDESKPAEEVTTAPVLEIPVGPEETVVRESLPLQKAISAPALDHTALVEQLSAGWQNILEASRGTNKKIEALLRSSCEPVAVEGNTVVLGFYYPYHKEMIEEDENRSVVEAILSKVLGADYQVRCILKPRNIAPTPQGHLVKAVMDMGGRIVDREP